MSNEDSTSGIDVSAAQDRTRGRHRAAGAAERAAGAAERAAGAAERAAEGSGAQENEQLLPPDAAARDAAKRGERGDADGTIHGEDIIFVTRRVDAEDRAAVIAVLTQVREEETRRVKRVARRDREPWARSQRVPEGISELLADG